jgi:predicted nucleic acid-binding protein
LAVVEANVNLPGHEFWPANLPLSQALKQIGAITGHRQVTDAYLLGLALKHGGKLATLDRGIAAIGPEGAVEFIDGES